MPAVFLGPDVLALVQVGATGFAVVMLTLGYQALKALMNEKPADNKTAVEVFRTKARAVNMFLGLSLLFVVLGIAGQYLLRAGEHELVVGVVPASLSPDSALVLHGIDVVKRDPSSGRARVMVRYQDDVSFDVSPMVERERALNTARAQAVTAQAKEGGFDEPH